MRERLYHLLRSRLSQERRLALKKRLAYERRRLAPVLRAVHGQFGAAELIAELDRRVPADAEIVMVHCSINDLHPTFTGSARDLLDALVDWTAPARTLVMPAFFFGGPAGDPAAYYRERPSFDARRTPSEMGLLSELFRRRPGVLRSLHPTTSVCALGPLAQELTSGHERAPSTYGEGTPFATMAARRTAIVGIGTEYFRCLTQVHAAEDLLGERFPVALRTGRVPVTLTAEDGSLHEYALAVNEAPAGRRLELLERLMSAQELLRWRFHGVPLFVTSAGRVTEVLVAAAQRGETIYEEAPIRAR